MRTVCVHELLNARRVITQSRVSSVLRLCIDDPGCACVGLIIGAFVRLLRFLKVRKRDELFDGIDAINRVGIDSVNARKMRKRWNHTRGASSR